MQNISIFVIKKGLSTLEPLTTNALPEREAPTQPPSEQQSIVLFQDILLCCSCEPIRLQKCWAFAN